MIDMSMKEYFEFKINQLKNAKSWRDGRFWSNISLVMAFFFIYLSYMLFAWILFIMTLVFQVMFDYNKGDFRAWHRKKYYISEREIRNDRANSERQESDKNRQEAN